MTDGAAAEKMSDSWGPHYFYDEHYPEFTTDLMNEDAYICRHIANSNV